MEEESPDVEMIGASNSKVSKTKKSCKVCGSNAMSNLQYGAIVCAGCRAFFRRIVVNQNEPKMCLFDCGGNQKCEVTAKKRSICPYCRFQKCLEIGKQQNPQDILAFLLFLDTFYYKKMSRNMRNNKVP